MVADLAQAQRRRAADQLAKHTEAPRQIADPLPGRLVDADVDEALEFVAVLIEDAERRVAGAGQLAGDLDHFVQHRLEVELGDEPPADVDQPAKPMLV